MYNNPTMTPAMEHGDNKMLEKQINEIVSLAKRGSEFHEHVATELNKHGGLRRIRMAT